MDTKALLTSLEQEIRRESSAMEQDQQLERLQEIARIYNGDDRVISSQELLDELKNTPVKPRFFSGFTALDHKMDGFTTGESIFLTGITKHGKTSFCMELSVRFHDQHPLWLSFEERAIDLMRKFTAKTHLMPHFFTPGRTSRRPSSGWKKRSSKPKPSSIPR